MTFHITFQKVNAILFQCPSYVVYNTQSCKPRRRFYFRHRKIANGKSESNKVLLNYVLLYCRGLIFPLIEISHATKCTTLTIKEFISLSSFKLVLCPSMTSHNYLGTSWIYAKDKLGNLSKAIRICATKSYFSIKHLKEEFWVNFNLF